MPRVGLILLCVLSLVGCGGGAPAKPLPDTVPVTGTITLDGKPLAFAAVTFVPGVQTKGIECTGLTDESGNYKLTQIRGKEGAPPGEYKVVVRCPKTGDGSPALQPQDGAPEAEGAPKGIAQESLPQIYSNTDLSRLSAVVPSEGGELNFDLKSK